MATENCDLCEKFGFTCRRGGLFERIAGRKKVVVMNDSKEEFGHDFPIETCEVVTGDVTAEKYSALLNKYINARKNGLIYPL